MFRLSATSVEMRASPNKTPGSSKAGKKNDKTPNSAISPKGTPSTPISAKSSPLGGGSCVVVDELSVRVLFQSRLSSGSGQAGSVPLSAVVMAPNDMRRLGLLTGSMVTLMLSSDVSLYLQTYPSSSNANCGSVVLNKAWVSNVDEGRGATVFRLKG